MTTQNCTNCRFHRKDTAPIPEANAGEGVTDGMLIAEDCKVFICTSPKGPHAGLMVGVNPVECPAWEGARVLNTSALDALEARLAARRARG